MNENKTWSGFGIKERRSSSGKGGRPSKVAEVLKMDMNSFFEMAGDGGSLNCVARALLDWAGSRGSTISTSTSKRAVKELINIGRITTVSVCSDGREWVLKPVKSLGL